MTHPLDALVDGILERAARQGQLSARPDIGELIAPYLSDAERPAGSVDVQVRRTASVIALTGLLETAQQEYARLPGPRSRAVKMAEIADLRHRLAAEIQALSKRG